ncbi:Glycine receptor subunit beta-type 4 [Aphelenchoides fujianensis]|nr:Glycine receptor subunit beta-type 4 [Aphelenchoides fujianensis]
MRSFESSFDVDFYIYTNWKDESLRHSAVDYQLLNNRSLFKQMWQPDLYFSNSRLSKHHDILLPNFSVFIDQHGNVAYSGRITATISCNFDLRLFPIDHQECHLLIVSYAHTADKLRIIWFENEGIRYHKKIDLPEFTIQSITPRIATEAIGMFSCLQANIRLKRSAVFHLVQSYVPSALIVIISWISFYIDRKAIHARITLWFTTLLSIFTVANSVKANVPPVSCIKALDVWIGVCLLFIICTLLEIAVVNTYMRRADRHERMAQIMTTSGRYIRVRPRLSSTSSRLNSLSIDNLTISFYAENEKDVNHQSPRIQELKIGHDYSRAAFEIDRYSRIVFPIGFSAFSCLYWVYYLLQAAPSLLPTGQ